MSANEALDRVDDVLRGHVCVFAGEAAEFC